MTRERTLQKIEEALLVLGDQKGKVHKKSVCALLAHRTLGRYLRQLKNGALKIDKPKAKAEKWLDGKYLLLHILCLEVKNSLEKEGKMVKIQKEGQFVKKIIGTLTLCVFFLGGTQDFSHALDKIRASHQPAKHALPTVLGIEKGWFKELGLDVSFSYFSAGMSQVEAGIAGEWDVGAMGSPPAIFGGIKYGLLSIGTSITQEMIEWLLINKKNYDGFKKNPKEWLKGKTILTTTISTGHYSLLANLKKWGLTEKDVKIVHIDQSVIISAFAAGEGDLYQAWAPFCYFMQGRGAVKVADGRTAGITIPGMLVATTKFAKKSPDLVAKWLQGYLRGVLYEYQYPGDAAMYLQHYYKMVGIELPYEACLE